MRKIWIILVLCLLAGCQNKETVEVNSIYSNRHEVVEETLTPIDEKESEEIISNEQSFDVFYDRVDESKVEFSIVNYTDYYYSGEIDFDVCEFKISFEAIVPKGEVSQTIECPNFKEDSGYSYTGQLYERNEGNRLNVEYNYYVYEEDEKLFDYLLNVDEITNEHLIELSNFLYVENILGNVETEMWIRVYPMEQYEETYRINTEAAWNDLDSNYVAGKIYLDTVNDLAEVYSKDDTLIKRINYAKK